MKTLAKIKSPEIINPFTPIGESVIVITDMAMREVYVAPFIDRMTVKIIDEDAVRQFNIFASLEQILKYREKVEAFPILIGGSSNFHHFTIAHIAAKVSQIGLPVQIVLIDRHMDCQQYHDHSKIVHCGNWISYCFRKRLISRIIMIGCENEMNQSSFDHIINKTGLIYYEPDITQKPMDWLIHPEIPVYLSLDTDILNLPNDWGKGKILLEHLLKMPLWDVLSKRIIVGASIMGHVTDNRRIIDFLKVVIKNPITLVNKISFNELVNDFLTTVFPKLWASITTRPLPVEEQFKVIRALFSKIYPYVLPKKHS